MKKFLIAAAVATAVAGPAAHADQFINVLTGGTSGVYYPLGVALTKIIADKVKGTKPSGPSTKASAENLNLLQAGRGEIAFTLGDTLADAWKGNKDAGFKAPLKKLRGLAAIYPNYIQIVARADSGIKGIADLKGKRVPDGYNQQKIIIPLMQAEYATAGITSKDIVPDPVPTVARGADDFAAGRADAFFFALGSAKVAEADAAVGGIRMLDIPNTPQNLAAVRKYVPPAYLRLEHPAKNLPGVTGPTHVIAYDSVFMTNDKVSDDMVYRITKAVWEHEADLKKSYAGFALFSRNTMAKKHAAPIEYHPGAIRFYKEKGMWPPKE